MIAIDQTYWYYEFNNQHIPMLQDTGQSPQATLSIIGCSYSASAYLEQKRCAAHD